MSKSTSKLLVFGGSGKPLQIYNPETKATKECPASPNPINGSGITVHGNLVFVVGGEGNMREIMTYDNEKDSWKVAQVMKTARTNAKVSFNRSTLYVVGGQDATGIPVLSIEMFDFQDGRFSFMKKADVPWLGKGDRKNYAVEGKNDRVYFVGGTDPSGASVNTFNYFDMQSHETVEMNPLLEARTHCATILWHNQIVALGGYSNADGSGTLGTVEAFSFKKAVWLNLPPLLAVKATESACLYDRKIWVIGTDQSVEAFATDEAVWEAI